MDERLKELEKQSVYYNEEEDVWEFDRTKFAESIVRECADLVKDYRDEMTFYRADLRIKEHFGVE
jgi:hypothetical protein